LVCFVVEAEKKREAKQRAKEAQEREVRKREKAEEKERRRKEYDALKASKREQEKKPKKEANQAPSKFAVCCKVPKVQGRLKFSGTLTSGNSMEGLRVWLQGVEDSEGAGASAGLFPVAMYF
jgi:sRNA-binding protein